MGGVGGVGADGMVRLRCGQGMGLLDHKRGWSWGRRYDLELALLLGRDFRHGLVNGQRRAHEEGDLGRVVVWLGTLLSLRVV